MSKYLGLKESTLKVNLDIPKHNLAIFTFGNVSAYDSDLKAMAIKPSGVPYDDLTVDDIVVLDLEGNVLEGSLRPSSDTPTHLHLYKKYSWIKGVVHTHSTYATSWAQSGRAIPVYGTTHADHSPREIPCAPVMEESKIKGDYEIETGYQITDLFSDLHLESEHCPMVLIEGHGPFTWGKSPKEALYNAAVLEEIARMAYITEAVAGGRKEPLPSYLINKHFSRKHGANAYYGQENK